MRQLAGGADQDDHQGSHPGANAPGSPIAVDAHGAAIGIAPGAIWNGRAPLSRRTACVSLPVEPIRLTIKAPTRELTHPVRQLHCAHGAAIGIVAHGAAIGIVAHGTANGTAALGARFGPAAHGAPLGSAHRVGRCGAAPPGSSGRPRRVTRNCDESVERRLTLPCQTTCDTDREPDGRHPPNARHYCCSHRGVRIHLAGSVDAFLTLSKFFGVFFQRVSTAGFRALLRIGKAPLAPCNCRVFLHSLQASENDRAERKGSRLRRTEG